MFTAEWEHGSSIKSRSFVATTNSPQQVQVAPCMSKKLLFHISCYDLFTGYIMAWATFFLQPMVAAVLDNMKWLRRFSYPPGSHNANAKLREHINKWCVSCTEQVLFLGGVPRTFQPNLLLLSAGQLLDSLTSAKVSLPQHFLA
jgi:hypothetical protein